MWGLGIWWETYSNKIMVYLKYHDKSTVQSVMFKGSPAQFFMHGWDCKNVALTKGTLAQLEFG
jgi:hypothetical protein